MFFCWTLQAFIILQSLSLLHKVWADPNDNTTPLNGDPANIPAPLTVPPSQRWLGNDGPWSSFFLRIGSPVQTLTVLISTASNQPLVVLPEGCYPSDPDDCSASRGGVFHRDNSSTWKQNELTKEGIFGLIIEKNLNYSINALYGNETVALSYPGSSAPSLQQQLVGGIASKAIYTGMIGLSPASTNFTDFNNPIESYMSTLKSQKQIPSLSYGYTAGNQYRFNKVLGSLTLGGYDASIIEPNELTFGFNADTNSDLTVNVKSISMTTSDGGRNLSAQWFPAYLDSTLPYLYLPIEVCRHFEEAFGITYDTYTELYLVNETLHTQLLARAANVTFTLTNLTSQILVDIILPYQAFDLIAEWPLVNQSTRYFPLKRASDNRQTTLGRTFFQEAYLVADYERSNFSVYQRKWDADAKADIRTIISPTVKPATKEDPPSAPPESKSTDTHTHPPLAIIIAAVVGGMVLLTLLICSTIVIRQRNRKLKLLERQGLPPISEPTVPHILPVKTYGDTTSPTSIARTELDGYHALSSPELEATPPNLHRFPNLATRMTPVRERVYELPANETVSELVGSPVQQSPLWRRHREIEEKRRRIRQQQQRKGDQ